MKCTSGNNCHNVSFKQTMALLCEESGNSKGSECKNVVTAHLEEGKYIWFLNELQDSVSKTKQVASGRFGVTTEYLVNAEEIQIKVEEKSG